MFAGAESHKSSFLEQTKAARAERALDKKRDVAVVAIQRRYRGYIARKKHHQRIIDDFDAFINTALPNHKTSDPSPLTAADITLRPCLEIYPIVSRFVKRVRVTDSADAERLELLCRYLIVSLDADTARTSYIGIALQKENSLAWIRHIKLLLFQCCECMKTLKPEHHSESVSLALYLHVLVAFTTPAQWALLRCKTLAALKPGMAQLCNNIMGGLVQKGFYQTLRTVLLKGTCRTQVVSLKPVSLAAVVTLATRPLVSAQFSDNLLSMFLVQILSVPALVYHLDQLAADSLASLQQLDVLQRSLTLLEDVQSMKIISNSMQGTQSLALIANLVQLFHLETLRASANRPANQSEQFVFVCTQLLQGIPNTVGSKSGAISQWHTLLGWFAPAPDAPQNENLALMKSQIYLLWSQRVVHELLGSRLKVLAVGYETIEFANMQPGSQNLFRRALNRTAVAGSAAARSAAGISSSAVPNSKQPGAWRKLGGEEITRVALVCGMYQAALTTLSQLKLDILSGLCYHDTLLHDLFLLLASVGPNCGLKPLLELLAVSPKASAPPLQMLHLFCNLMTHYVIILDDIEMYEQQEPFQLTDYTGLSYFLNNFLYKSIQDNIFETRHVSTDPLFIAMHTLLLCLYRRDCRRQFAPSTHWLIHELRPAAFIGDLDKSKRHAQILLQRMPHIIPHEDRVKLFRRYVQNEKAILGVHESVCAGPTSALITVHRDRIVEDGYRQLAALPANSMKGVIRVRFINQQGLDEAGIDQDGVFKEFLEETIQRVFDPSLNLFKITGDHRLYPSPTSHMQENHLQLFEFVGLMLGKAVYEGIVVDVPFASFFLSQLLGQTHQALYSCIDELPSLDTELYRSLTFIKHYDGDVADLDLTFSVDEDQMGRIVTYELHPGGRSRPVTNDNKINYIHYSAYFRMHTQIREQTTAFIRGFRSIVNTDWLMLFSTPELQRLISGDTTPLDLKDLRKHTQYYGGFHDSHRVVGWLWDILAKDFTENERKLFLKFVTSCSKPPLLGFAHLEPPFSIRCVEVGDDEDTGDTIGSVIRGFFTIRKKDPLNRLPTSSTCFNLLKLPNYQKKNTLREKLRYAVSSNTGFELS